MAALTSKWIQKGDAIPSAKAEGRYPSFRQAMEDLARLAILGLAIVAASAYLPAQSQPTEYGVKAAYLFNFMRFTQWPPAFADGPLRICVLGQDRFGPVLDTTVAGEAIDGRNVIALRISEPKEAPNCHILFISSSEDERLQEILLSIENLPVLTVSDAPHFVEQGGMIQFVLQQGKVRFEVNLAVCARAGLTLSSDLLKLATRVRKNRMGS
jgi:hypothetical protein